jgi:hypothetical protein
MLSVLVAVVVQVSQAKIAQAQVTLVQGATVLPQLSQVLQLLVLAVVVVAVRLHLLVALAAAV